MRRIILTVTLSMILCGISWAQELPKGAPGFLFSFPEVPSVLVTPESRASYVAEHYWEGFSFTDRSYLSDKDIFEQIYVDFINILPISNRETAMKATRKMIKTAYEGKVLKDLFIEMSDKYLYDPNSPYYSEETYLWILEELLQIDQAPASRYRYAGRYKLLNSNRKGDVAADFTVTLSSGSKLSLSDLHTDYILVFFNNPDCDECRRMKSQMDRSKSIRNAVQDKRLTVFAVYPDGDLPLWKKSSYPSFMLNGYDEGMTIIKKGLYDLKGMPTLYLLDKNRRVLLKDASLEDVLNRIST